MNYLTVKGEATATYEVQHSVFICSIKGITDFDDGMSYVKSVSQKYSNATHNCYAITAISGEQKFSDNGEPQGTAGQPILQVLKKRKLNNVACVITRYFGGIKLGTGGLVAAYTQATVDGIDNASIVEKKESVLQKAEIEYSDYALLNSLLNTAGYPVIDRVYDNKIQITFGVPVEENEIFTKKISETFNGKLKTQTVSTTYVEY